ncbi:energy transducer TonB [Pseudoalteromonas luteoviolacea]|uniref:energy transducer TonB family protein n=1 Tax=Pseudoalteromonas luteoviolacea TaxID=43657 RepID=UPI001B39E93F|nr:energy transducer TonB [Pseudoalteromonas luteoviolacea]MBQ4908209.1 energy transducer TonB [Pseudoalteromonas luteoviolacea]
MLTRRDWLLGFFWAVCLHLVILGAALWHWQPHTPAKPAISKAPFVVKLAPLAKAKSQSQELQNAQAQSANTPPPKALPTTPSSDIALAHDGKIAMAKKPQKPQEPKPKPEPKPTQDRKPKLEQVAEQPPQAPKPEQLLELPKQDAEKPAKQESVASRAKEIETDATAQQNQALQQGQDTQLALVAKQTWQAVLIAHLAKKKRYPTIARKRGQEATIMVSFDIDDKGQARNIEIVQSSRYPLLNKEAKSVVKRAQPLPLPPPSMREHTVMVPVRFYLM